MNYQNEEEKIYKLEKANIKQKTGKICQCIESALISQYQSNNDLDCIIFLWFSQNLLSYKIEYVIDNTS